MLRPPASVTFIAVYVITQFGSWIALLTPVVLTIALRVGEITTEAEKGRWLGGILAVGGFVALGVTPICGGALRSHPESFLPTPALASGWSADQRHRH
jgi:hypothetical protein